MDSRRLVILDGYSLLFRAFYGTRYLSTSDGRPTNALFGFLNMLLALFADETTRPDVLAVALDAPGKTFRHADFAEYKGTRRETPPELVSQLDFSRQMMRDLSIPTIEILGYEADDIIGTVSRMAKEQGIKTIIVSGDHDSLQLVDEDVHVLMPQNGPNPPKLYTAVEVMGRYSLTPPQIKDYKALAGDSSDNIPGVPGIGEKSATLLLQEFGTVEVLMERLAEVPEKFRKKIEPALDKMILSKKLATIDREAPVEFAFESFRLDPGAYAKAKQSLLDLEFKSQVKRMDVLLAPYFEGRIQEEAAPAAEVVAEPLSSQEIPLPASLRDWIGSAVFSVLPAAAEASASLFEEQQPSMWWVAKGREACLAPEDLVIEAVREKSGQMVGHDLKDLYKKLPTGQEAPWMDTLLGGYVLQSGRSGYDLNDLLAGYLEGALIERPDQKAVGLLLLDKEMREKIKKEGQERILEEVELPLIPVLAAMEKRGITVSADMLLDFGKSLGVKIDESKRLIWEMAGEEFNIGSPKQIGEVLFEKMGLPGGKKTKTGWATGEEILGEMAATHEIAAQILEYRGLTKLKSTYADSLPKMIGRDGRIHTSFNQAVAATGRLSSKDPNLQNIPIRDELGRMIRKAFVAAPGESLLSLDYSQIELRVLAHMCEDPNLCEAFQKGSDVHAATAALMFGVSEGEVSREQRRLAKILNFAVLYGAGGFGLANQLGPGFGTAEANALVKQYNERFPKIKAFTEGLVEEARSKGFTTTLMGRRRHFPEIHASNRSVRQAQERQAMNAPIQGTAADMIKAAMIRVHRELGDGPVKMLLQVHDELVFEGGAEITDSVAPVRIAMETSHPLKVPVVVDAKMGQNWMEMEPLG